MQFPYLTDYNELTFRKLREELDGKQNLLSFGFGALKIVSTSPLHLST